MWKSRANAPSSGTLIGPVRDIGSRGKEYVFGRGLTAFRMFAVHDGDEVRVYVNACPHYSLPLNHCGDDFLTRAGDRIMCRQHLALFAIDDGRCLDGACEGEGLEPVPVHIEEGFLVVD
jgi:nitrite reductase/ring-hydroxylating ferredoxin subunit